MFSKMAKTNKQNPTASSVPVWRGSKREGEEDPESTGRAHTLKPHTKGNADPKLTSLRLSQVGEWRMGGSQSQIPELIIDVWPHRMLLNLMH